VGHGFVVDPGHSGTRRDGDFAGNESVMVDAHGYYRASAGIVRVFRRPGVDARAVNRRATLKARRTLCGLKLHSPREVTLFAVKCMESRLIKTNLLVWVQVEAICRGRIDRPRSA